MSETVSAELPRLLARWMAHDLATPIASVMTASELLDDREPDAEINGLIQDGAKRLAGRIRLIRAALAGGDAAIGGAALEKLVREGLHDMRLDWQRGQSDATGGEASLVAAACLLLADVGRGRGLAVGDANVALDPPMTLPEPIISALAGDAPAEPRAGVAAMVAAAAARAGRTLTVTAGGLAWA